MCVQGVDVQCVLQFTLIHAAGCALHRRTSRVIHRIELSSFVQVSTARATRAEGLRLDGARSFFLRSQWALTGPKPRCVGLGTSTGRGPAFKKVLGGCDARPAFRRDCEAEAPSRPGPLWSGAAFKPDAFPSAQKVTRHPTVGPKPEGFAGECPLVRAARRPFRPAAVDFGSRAFRAKAAHFCERVSR